MQCIFYDSPFFIDNYPVNRNITNKFAIFFKEMNETC